MATMNEIWARLQPIECVAKCLRCSPHILRHAVLLHGQHKTADDGTMLVNEIEAYESLRKATQAGQTHPAVDEEQIRFEVGGVITNDHVDYVTRLVSACRRQKARADELGILLQQKQEAETNALARLTRAISNRRPRGPCIVPKCLEALSDKVRPCAVPIDRRPAVYFLFLGEELVYIGQAVGLLSRVGVHIAEDKKLFDAVFYMAVKPGTLDDAEATLIRHFRPVHNAVIPRERHSATACMIRRSFNLPEPEGEQDGNGTDNETGDGAAEPESAGDGLRPAQARPDSGRQDRTPVPL